MAPNRTDTKSTRWSSSTKFSRALSFLPRRQSTAGPSSPPYAETSNEYGLNTLFEPAGPLIIADFIFVHGLGGGSSSTWCRKQDPESFWPKEWLPRDADFQDVRIHSFGYNADWSRLQTNNKLDVHDFGQSLVEEIHNNPSIRGHETSIVLIGHSMGGLVIKKACILSKTNPEFAGVANRLHSFYFLGTPHRGSNLAITLNNILRISGTGRRASVTGLGPGSELIRVLNDQFRIHYRGIHLHTFYETLPTPPIGLVVDAESATLGYAEERHQLLNAAHRDLARFESIHDSNYHSLRNRLATTVKQIRADRVPQQLPSIPQLYWQDGTELPQSAEEQLQTVAEYLSFDRTHKEVLSSLDEFRLKGSCSWLVSKPTFQEWMRSGTPRYFWLRGPPACGKSVLASYIIDYLRDHPTCYFFFGGREKSIPSLSSFMRSMAYQMAEANPQVLSALLRLAKQGPPIDVRNTKTIWHNVFTSCVFHEKFLRPHYWVIDALDEAVDGRSTNDFFHLLSKIGDEIPLKVLIASRHTESLDHMFASLPTIPELINTDDSVSDIRLYVEASSATLPVHDTRERKDLIKRIVDKSDGNFLWTVLVMQQLREVVTVEDVHDVLEKVPQRMSELYSNNIKKMESAKGKNIAKHIITWAMCATHTLTVDQMQDAIKLSLDTRLARDLRDSLQYLCGQFLVINKQSRIQVVHETARAFLTSSSLDSEFRIDPPDGHEMIALACLKYLLSDELKYSKRRRSVVVSKTSMADYAILRLSDHIMRASSSSNQLFDLLLKFFNGNVLSWIECVAQLKDLDCLIRTSRHLSNYLRRRSRHLPLISGDLNAWTVDLPRIVTQFGANLLSDPAAIHTLIPPFCPRGSAIYRHFGYAEDGIKLVGAWNTSWDDRICSISHHEMYATSVATLDQRFAVGLSDGAIEIYRLSTCEALVTFQHGESVSILQFGATSKLLASAGLRRVKLWNLSSESEIFELKTESQTLAIAFNETETLMMVASRDKHISSYEVLTGHRVDAFPWTDTFVDPTDTVNYYTPHAVRISIEQQVMAVVYRSKPVQLWSLESQRPIGACIRQSTNKHTSAGHIVHSAVLNPNAACQSLVVSYWDEVVVIFDTATCKPIVSVTAALDRLAVSPNGKTLAGGDPNGGIKIFDFETLQFLHQIPINGDPITSLAFTTDSLRIIDARGTQSNVWEPTVLVSQDSDSSASEPSDSVRQVAYDIESSLVDVSSSITALYCCEDSGITLCGRSNGWVDTCYLDDPEKTMRNLYKHKGSFTSVACIDWAYKARIAISADSAGHFQVMHISTGTRREWSAKLVFESVLEQGCPVSQVLVSSDGTLVFVSSSASDSVWSVSTKSCIAKIPRSNRTAWKWFARVSTPNELILVEDNTIQTYSWLELTPLSFPDSPRVSLGDVQKSENQADPDAISIASDSEDLVFAQTLIPSRSSLKLVAPLVKTTTKISVFDLTVIHQGHSTNKAVMRHVAEIPDIGQIIGTFKRFNTAFLLFLSRGGWVCSVELGPGLMGTFQKHFFIPSVWQTGNSSLITKVRRNQDVVFAHNNGIILVKNGLDNGEHIAFV